MEHGDSDRCALRPVLAVACACSTRCTRLLHNTDATLRAFKTNWDIIHDNKPTEEKGRHSATKSGNPPRSVARFSAQNLRLAPSSATGNKRLLQLMPPKNRQLIDEEEGPPADDEDDVVMVDGLRVASFHAAGVLSAQIFPVVRELLTSEDKLAKLERFIKSTTLKGAAMSSSLPVSAGHA